MFDNFSPITQRLYWLWTRLPRSTRKWMLGILNTLFFLEKHIRSNPSHSSNLMEGGGFFGTIRTTEDSTCGGGLKLFLSTYRKLRNLNRETFIICDTWAHICTLTLRRQYNASPGLATRRNANSLWNINIHILGNGLHCSNLNTRGEEI